MPYKNLKDRVRSFILLLFLLAFISADIIFHKFLELHSLLLSVKKIFVSFFFNGFTQIPHPINDQNPLIYKNDKSRIHKNT